MYVRRSLTGRQRQMLDAIRRHVEEKGAWPSYEELRVEMGWQSPNSVTQVMKSLAQKGYITKQAGSGYWDFAPTSVYVNEKTRKKLIAHLEVMRQELVKLGMDKERAMSLYLGGVALTTLDYEDTRSEALGDTT
jgi:SOS-response transcriptional repressor LexA